MGTGVVAANMYPAKYSFDIDAAPSCTNDYVVFGLNVAGEKPGQANLLGVEPALFEAPGGLCGTGNANVNWAYNGSTAPGAVLTSPVISLDGKKIAYVESAAGSASFSRSHMESRRRDVGNRPSVSNSQRCIQLRPLRASNL